MACPGNHVRRSGSIVRSARGGRGPKRGAPEPSPRPGARLRLCPGQPDIAFLTVNNRNVPRFKRPDQEGLPRGLVREAPPETAGRAPSCPCSSHSSLGRHRRRNRPASASPLATTAAGLPRSPTPHGPTPRRGSLGGRHDGIREEVQPIDLASALRLAGRDLDIATARQRVLQALAELEKPGLWLPSLFTGPTYYRVDGQVQTINGQVQTVSRGSLFLGTTAAWPTASPPRRRGPAILR